MLGIGVVVAISAVVVRHLCVLLVGLLMLAGQLVTAVVLDAIDPSTRAHITPHAILALVDRLLLHRPAEVGKERSPNGAVSRPVMEPP